MFEATFCLNILLSVQHGLNLLAASKYLESLLYFIQYLSMEGVKSKLLYTWILFREHEHVTYHLAVY